MNSLPKHVVQDRRVFHKPISYDSLYYYYITKKKSAYFLAKKFTCSTDRIYRELKKHNIPIRKRNKGITSSQLHELYVLKNLPISKIANKLHISKTTVYSKLKKWNLYASPTKTFKNPISLPASTISVAYENGSSMKDLATTYNTSSYKIKQILLDLEIPLRHKNHRLGIDTNLVISLYTETTHTVEKIAQILSVSPSTISKILRESHTPIRGNQILLDVETIIHAYITGSSVTQLSKKHNVSYGVIRKLLITHNVYKPAKRFKEYTPHIISLYEKDCLSVESIASYYSCHPETIRRIIRKHTKSKINKSIYINQ